jgi:hypothetical protein
MTKGLRGDGWTGGGVDGVGWLGRVGRAWRQMLQIRRRVEKECRDDRRRG